VNLSRFLLIFLILISLLVYFFLTRVPSNKVTTTGELPKLYPYPVTIENPQKPAEISAKSAIIIDAKTGVALFEKDPDTRHLPASTTKLLTAIVAQERCDPQKVVKVERVVEEGTQMGLSEGDLVSVGNLLYGLLVASGNDAAFVLADSCSDSYIHFVASMNQKAKELGMKNSHFINPAGFDDPLQYSTARDLAKLAKVAVANLQIAKIVATRSIVVTDQLTTKTYYLENINKLLGEVEGLEGVKTGQTEGSLEILLTKTTRNSHTIITAVLGSDDRFSESKQLIEWVFANHRWVNPE